jgi:hypothetical protein
MRREGLPNLSKTVVAEHAARGYRQNYSNNDASSWRSLEIYLLFAGGAVFSR